MKSCYLFCTGFCFCLAVHAAEIADLEAALRLELERLRTETGIPGINAAFVLPDGGFGQVSVGTSDPRTGRALQPGDRMLAASIGKSFVGAAALALSAEGRLDLDAPLSDWLGELPWYDRLPNAKQIRVRHLLHHRSGLPDHVHLPSFQRAVRARGPEKPPFSCAELAAFVLDAPALFAPGEGWAYSDTNYVLLGMVLERACGRSLYEEVGERFLIPLRLRDTHPSDRRDLPGLVPGFTGKDNPFGFPAVSTDARGRMRWHPGIERWGGGWMSSAGDLARWGDALFTGAALPPEARKELHRTVPTDPAAGSPRYGAGVSLHPEGPLGPTLGHGGWIPGYVSSLRHYRDHRLTVALQVNTDEPATAAPDWVGDLEIRAAGVLIRQLTEERARKAEVHVR